ncbi:unnamed protein product [Owenia fusiformis]|uniref:Uncharacterized protein n=1 Tax=Owenia fusiformis TaxID=6347 RepID=A0A8S4N1A1_OWEFU|nr:unnamed protein product [Owenia fusiformis]
METDNVEATIKEAMDDSWRQSVTALIVRKNTTHFKQLLQEEMENLIFPNMLRNLQRSMLASDVYFKLHELAQLGDLNYDIVQSFRDTVYGVEDKGVDIEPRNSTLLDLQFLILSKESPIGQLLDITSANNDASMKDVPNATDIAQKDPQEEIKGCDDIKDKTVSAETKQQLLAQAMGQLNTIDDTFQSSREQRPEILEEIASKEKMWHPREDMTTALTTDLFMTKAKLLVSYRRTTKLVTALIQQAKKKEKNTWAPV